MDDEHPVHGDPMLSHHLLNSAPHSPSSTHSSSGHNGSTGSSMQHGSDPLLSASHSHLLLQGAVAQLHQHHHPLLHHSASINHLHLSSSNQPHLHASGLDHNHRLSGNVIGGTTSSGRGNRSQHLSHHHHLNHHHLHHSTVDLSSCIGDPILSSSAHILASPHRSHDDSILSSHDSDSLVSDIDMVA